MTLASRIALIVLLVAPGTASAQSRTAIAVGAGPSFPTGRFRDTQANGTDFNLGLIRGSDDTPVGLRFDFAYDKLKGKSVGGAVAPEKRVTSGTVNLLFSFAGYTLKPYFVGGVGGYKMTSRPSTLDAKIRFGFNFGMGLTLPVAGKAAFVEARLNSVSQPHARPVRYVPLLFGFLF